MSLRWKSRLTRLAVAHFVALALIGSSVGLVSAASSVTLDVDGNGTADALTDGFVIVRFLFGFRGDTLVSGVVDPAGSRTTPEGIVAYLGSLRTTMLDVDCNGRADALTDGVLIVRFLLGFEGDTLTGGAVDPSGCRTTAAAIAEFLEGFLPGQPGITLPLDADLFDDFNADRIDRTKWRNLDFVRRVRNGLFESALARFGSNGSNNLRFINPTTVTSFQADVAVTDVSNTNAAPRARLQGSHYNDGTSGGGAVGDIRGDISIRHNGTDLMGTINVFRCDVPNCSKSTPFFSDETTFGSVVLGATHTLSIDFDETTTTITFGFDGATVSVNPIDGIPLSAGPPRSPLKFIGTRVSGISGPDEGAFIAAIFDNVLANGTLYDDFESNPIDRARWRDSELVTQVDNRVLVSGLTRFGSIGNNSLVFVNPVGVNAIRADVSVTDVGNTNAAPRARLQGSYYNDGAPGDGAVGDVRGDISIRHNGTDLVGTIIVFRCEDPDCTLITILFFDETTFGSVVLGETHTLSIDFDEVVTSFTFGFDDTTVSVGPTDGIPLSVGPPQGPVKFIGTRVSGIDGPDEGASINATFDNVFVDGVLYDDFGSGIDRTKWANLDVVRRVENGVFKSAITRFGSNDINTLTFIDTNAVTTFEADVTVTDVDNTGALPLAGLVGAFYNDGTMGEGSTGEVLAGIGISHNGTELVGVAFVGRCDDPNCNSLTFFLFDNTTFGPVSLGESRRLSLALNGTTFTFDYDGTTVSFDPTGDAPVAGPPRFPFKGIGTLVSGINGPDVGAFIAATFDNVNRNGVPYDDFGSDKIDRTNWANLELVRRAGNGVFKSALTRFASGDINRLNFVDPMAVDAFEAEVTVTEVSNTGDLRVAGLMGAFCNDGTMGEGSTGDVLAAIGISHNGTELVGLLLVGRCDDPNCDSLTPFLFDTTTFGPVALGETHRLSLAWDGTTFAFGFDDQTFEFDPTTDVPVAGPPRVPFKDLRTQVNVDTDEGVFISATFDNVRVLAID